jgi:hypothetical protein
MQDYILKVTQLKEAWDMLLFASCLPSFIEFADVGGSFDDML